MQARSIAWSTAILEYEINITAFNVCARYE